MSKTADPKRKSGFGQFFTPAAIARFMGDLFTPGERTRCRLLDAGAGIGSLSAAFLDRWVSGGFAFKRVHVDAFEIDEHLCPHLEHTLDQYRERRGFTANTRCVDFVNTAAAWVSGDLFARHPPAYTHAILNPPYRKIRSDSRHRVALREAGVETVNLYSAFVALSLCLLVKHGQLVAIIPRSFCNGSYYRSFREFVFQRSALRRIHLFTARDKAFRDDAVLQENVIVRLDRSAKQGPVTVSTSTDDTFSDLKQHVYPQERIVSPEDPNSFIHIPTSPGRSALESQAHVRHSLDDLGITVSTGPVVDFRVKAHLRDLPEKGTVPLLYPMHFRGQRVSWPIRGAKKPNAIARSPDTEKWLYPNGFYCVVRRFSSKEERRRIVASVVDPAAFSDAPLLGFENHLNVFHEERQGLPKALAFGLAVFLNSAAVDEQFRRFNGHTQVNATDLRAMTYPDRAVLIQLGDWAIREGELTEEMIDAKLVSLSP